ncbi:membrane protein [Sorangium cellulosum]|uniref:Membrane protein n=1 Tax=Sorangium cellulosum TaxID=56 RepID=A0A2L0EMM3_SORCE|nr:DoxX family protein [Sorangium cellulosum]AUX40539.1 membrane protein [Sorangium cellulosum]
MSMKQETTGRLGAITSVPRSAELAALVLRLGLGAVFLAHAAAKVFVFTLPGTVAFFTSSGFPGWTAYPVFLAELLGGAALVAGFKTRLVALALLPVMAGALLVHLPSGWMFTSPGGGWEYVAFLMVTLLAQALLGDGAFAAGQRQRG